ncbi:hypothetical protein ZWY2020_013068 [Hordeum vulgare]|nr:hypothetical protein ZWY2020_013068 [Hordeum vulgare]
MATTAGTRTGATLGTHASTKLCVLLTHFFVTSHIEPFTDLAIRLAAAASPDAAVEATVAVTPANVSIVLSMLKRRYGDAAKGMPVKIATYPFPAVDGLPRGVENLGKAAAADLWRIDAAAVSDALMRPVQEALVRERYGGDLLPHRRQGHPPAPPPRPSTCSTDLLLLPSYAAASVDHLLRAPAAVAAHLPPPLHPRRRPGLLPLWLPAGGGGGRRLWFPAPGLLLIAPGVGL